MILLKIFDVDSVTDDKPLSILKIGEHTVGRDSFGKSSDRSISRKHARIKIDDEAASLTSIHVNPCFYTSCDSQRVEILDKDVPKPLTNGDKFAFTANKWYRIKILKLTDIETQRESNSHTKLPEKTASESSSLEINQSSSQVINGNSTYSAVDFDKSKEAITLELVSSSVPSESRSLLKRSLQELQGGNRKKMKTINESLDALLNNIHRITTSDENKNKCDNDVSMNEVYKKKDEVDESNDEDSNNDAPEVTVDSEIVTSAENQNEETPTEKDNEVSEENDNNQVARKDSDVLNDVNKEPMDDTNATSDDQQNENKKDEERKEEVSDSDKEDGEKDVKPSSSDLQNASKNEDRNPPEKDTVSSVKQEDGPSGSNSSNNSKESMGKKLRRDQCWYGGNCFRQNSAHRSEFSHPGDPDYDVDDDDDDDATKGEARPACAYGAQCYRKNRQHRNEYSHPTRRPAPKPAASNNNNNNKRKRKAVPSAEANSQQLEGSDISEDEEDDDDDDVFSNIDANTPIGKRKRRAATIATTSTANGIESDDNEEEDDPFKDDGGSSSENYEENDSDSDFSEPNCDGEEESEEVKTLVKEAKKFLRKKKNE